MKKIVAVLVALALAGLLGWQVWNKLNKTGEKTQARRGRAVVMVEATTVRRADMARRISYPGSLEASAQFIISPRIPGRLRRLLVNIGDSVTRNQVVVEIVDEEYRLAVERAEAALDVAKAQLSEAISNLEVAQKGYRRQASLGGKKIVSQADLEEAEGRYKAAQAKRRLAQAQVAQQEAILKEAKVQLSYTQIKASWRGGSDRRVVGQRFVDEGSLLKANEPIATVLELKPVIGAILVTERDYPNFRIGQTVVVRAEALPDKVFNGRVLRIAPLIDKASRQARVELEIPNDEGLLKPGMFITAQIVFEVHRQAQVIPLSALAERQGKKGVFVINQGDKPTVHFQPIEPGFMDMEKIEIVSPEIKLPVVSSGHFLLSEGAPIRLTGEKKPGPTGDKKGNGKGKKKAKGGDKS